MLHKQQALSACDRYRRRHKPRRQLDLPAVGSSDTALDRRPSKKPQSGDDGGTGTYTVKSTTWTNPENVESSYTLGATPVPLPQDTGTTMQFYWDAGNNTLLNTFSVTQDVTRSVEEALPTSSLTYLVLTPNAPSEPANYQPTQYGLYKPGVPTNYLSSGTELSPPGSLGIEIAFTATAPPAITGYKGGGYFTASQIITSIAGPHTTPAPSVPAADACPLFTSQYSGGGYGPGPPLKAYAAGAVVQVSAIDAPGTSLIPTDGSSFTISTGFVDYFIFRPTGANAVWVSLGTLSWSFGGTLTTSSSGVVTMTNPINSSSSSASSSTAQPVWSSVFNPGGQSCTAPPTS